MLENLEPVIVTNAAPVVTKGSSGPTSKPLSQCDEMFVRDVSKHDVITTAGSMLLQIDDENFTLTDVSEIHCDISFAVETILILED